MTQNIQKTAILGQKFRSFGSDSSGGGGGDGADSGGDDGGGGGLQSLEMILSL